MRWVIFFYVSRVFSSENVGSFGREKYNPKLAGFNGSQTTKNVGSEKASLWFWSLHKTAAANTDRGSLLLPPECTAVYPASTAWTLIICNRAWLSVWLVTKSQWLFFTPQFGAYVFQTCYQLLRFCSLNSWFICNTRELKQAKVGFCMLSVTHIWGLVRVWPNSGFSCLNFVRL